MLDILDSSHIFAFLPTSCGSLTNSFRRNIRFNIFTSRVTTNTNLQLLPTGLVCELSSTLQFYLKLKEFKSVSS